MHSIKDLFQTREIKKPPKYQWQELALQIIGQIPDSFQYKKSIFKACKIDPRRAKLASLECKELQKNYSLYFLKVFNSLR